MATNISLLVRIKMTTSALFAGLVLMQLTSSCKVRNSDATTKDYKAHINDRFIYLCWSGMLAGLKDKLVFCEKSENWIEPKRKPVGAVVAFKAEQFYGKVRENIPVVSRDEKEKASQKFEETWRLERSDLSNMQKELDAQLKLVDQYNGEIANMETGAVKSFFEGRLEASKKRIKSLEIDIASLKKQIPAGPQSESDNKIKDQDAVDLLRAMIERQGTIGSDELGDPQFNQMKTAVLRTVELGAPVELLWHWIALNQNDTAEKFINIPRTTDLLGNYLLLTGIKASDSLNGEWGLTVYQGGLVVRNVKSNTGPLKPREYRRMNLLIPIGVSKDNEGKPYCPPSRLMVKLMECRWFLPTACDMEVGSKNYIGGTVDYSIGRYNFWTILGNPRTEREAGEFDFEGIDFCIL